MKVTKIADRIAEELKAALASLEDGQAEALVEAVEQADRVFVAGAGRSGLMMRGLAMRLMQIGFTSYVAGETVTPAIGAKDLFIVGSGSGETATLTVMAQKAKKAGAKLALVTIYPHSTLGQMADYALRIEAATSKAADGGTAKSVQPGANSFEQSLLLVNDALVIRLMERGGIAQDNKLLMKNHANLE